MRKRARLSQTELAESVSVSLQTVARWESGERLPNAGALKRLAIALGTTVTYLMQDEDDEVPTQGMNIGGNGNGVVVGRDMRNVSVLGNAGDAARIVVKRSEHGDTQIEFPQGTDPEYIATLLAALEQENVRRGGGEERREDKT